MAGSTTFPLEGGDLHERVVVVTGGARGIGRAACLAAGRRGATVIVADKNAGEAGQVAGAITATGSGRAIAVECDVTDEASVKAVLETAGQHGPVRGLVTSAGIDIGSLAHLMTLESWQRVLSVNLTGTFLACKHALAAMVDHGKGGSVVCVSSAWATVSAPGGATAYCASKGGVASLVRSLALDYAPHGIRVNSVVPGATDTDLMWANIAPSDVPATRRRLAAQVALGRLAEPGDIAPGIVWLLSEDSRYSTGADLVLDGGLLAKGSVEC